MTLFHLLVLFSPSLPLSPAHFLFSLCILFMALSPFLISPAPSLSLLCYLAFSSTPNFISLSLLQPFTLLHLPRAFYPSVSVCHPSLCLPVLPFLLAAVAGTPGVSGVSPRAQSEDDGGEKTSPVPGGGLQRGGSPQGPQVSVRAPQGLGREGGSNCHAADQGLYLSAEGQILKKKDRNTHTHTKLHQSFTNLFCPGHPTC